MEIYAAMIDNMDTNIGRLIQHLKKIGQYDNTLFVFLSDNGPDVFELNETPDSHDPLPYMGTSQSFIAYGAQWAHASSAVNSLYKGYSAEGGIHTPMIIRLPHQSQGRGVTNTFASILDLAPTFLEFANGTYPDTYKGFRLAPYQGQSMVPFLAQQASTIHPPEYAMGWELFGRCALRQGKWKITKIERPFGTGDFQLFDLQTDPTESHDLSQQYPDLYRQMLAKWKDYVRNNGVIAEQR